MSWFRQRWEFEVSQYSDAHTDLEHAFQPTVPGAAPGPKAERLIRCRGRRRGHRVAKARKLLRIIYT